MKNNSLTIEQAKDLCDRSQYLIGEILTQNSESYIIKCVAVAPYDKINMLLFLELYKEMQDVAQSISFYKGTKFDVAIILQQINKDGGEQFKVMDLETYFEKSQCRQELAIQSPATTYHASL